MLAAIRPDDEHVPLFVHVVGAIVLVGGLLTVTTALAVARGNTGLLRLGYYSLVAIALPGWLAMFAGAEWIYREQGLADEPIDSAWVLIGFLVAEVGGLVLLVSLILGGIGVRRLRAGKGTRLLETTLAMCVVLLTASVVAVWAMAGKPG